MSTLMEDSTSCEAITRSLRSTTNSYEEKLSLANAAWSTNVVFPHKNEFFLEWCLNIMAKSAGKNSTPNAPLNNVGYWSFLREVLKTSFAHSVGIPGGLNLVNPAIILKSPFIPLFVSSLGVAERGNDPSLVFEIFEVFTLLVGTELVDSFKPTLEQLSSLLQVCLSGLVHVYHADHSTEILETFLKLGNVLTAFVCKNMTASANQRKVFTIVTGKLFSPLLQVLDITQNRTEGDYLELYNNITALLRFSLFHLDYIMDYSTILPYDPSKNSEKANRGIQSYQKQLFDQIHTLIKNKPASDILYVYRSFPVLFSYFIENCRRKQKSLTSTSSSSKDNSSLTEVVRTMEFAFFLEFYKLVEKSYLDSVQPGESLATRGTGETQDVLNNLLSLLLKHNVYHLTNDKISVQQYEMLQRSMENFLQMYKLQPESETLQTGLFKSCDILLQLDNRIIEKHLEDIWKLALNPLEGSFENCEGFVKNLMITYAKSRQFDSYVTGLFKALREVEDLNGILDRPIFSNLLLEEFTHSVTTLPNAQHQEILSLFSSELAEHVISEAPTKKRKTSDETSLSIGYNQSVEPLGILMSRFLKGVKSDNMARKKLEPGFTRIFQDFVLPTLNAFKSRSESDSQYLGSYLYPALFLHQSICDVSMAYWAEHSSTEWILEVVDSLESKCVKEPRVQLFLCVLLLQHVERLASSPGDLTGSELTTICEGLIAKAINASHLEAASLNSIWDGSLTHLTCDNLPVAYYKRLVGDCFEVVGRYASKDQLRKLLAILIKSYVSPAAELNSDGVGFGFRSITVKLLNNAQFFELIPVKESFLEVFLEILQVKLRQDYGDQYVEIVGNEKNALVIKQFTTVLVKQGSIEATSLIHMSEYIRLIEMLNLFPCEYFDKHDRDKIILASLYVDKLLTSTENLDDSLLYGPLATRVLMEKLLAFHIDGSIILQDFQFLNYLLSTVTCSAQSKTISEGVKRATSTIQKLCLNRVFTLLTNTETAEKSVAYLEDAVSVMSQFSEKVAVIGNAETLYLYNFACCYTEYIESHYAKSAQPSTPLQFLHTFTLRLEEAIHPALVKLNSELNSLLSTGTGTDINELMRPIVNAEYLIYLFWGLLRYQRVAVTTGNEQSKKLFPLISIVRSLSLVVNRMLVDEQAADSTMRLQFLQVVTHFLGGFCGIVFDLEPDVSSDTVTSITTLLVTLKETTHDKEITQKLTESFTKLISKSPREYTAKLLETYLSRIDILCSAPDQNFTHKVNEPAVILNTINAIFTSVDHSQKRYFKRYIPRLIGKLILLLQCTNSIELILEALTLLKNLCSDITMEYRTSDLVGVLDCLNQLGSPTLINRLREALDETKANQIFDGIYHVLLSLVKSRRDQLSEIFPNLTSVLGPLFYCFVTEHQTVSRRQQSKSKSQSQTTYGKTKPFSVITTFAPLSDLTAQNFARLITTLCTRPTNQAGKPSTSTFLKAFGKHAPYLIAEYLSIQTNPTASISKLSIRNAIIPGLYALLDLCGEHERDMVMVTLDLTGKSLFKSLYSDYLQYHKYTGKA